MGVKFLLEVDDKGAIKTVREFKGELNALEPAGKKAAAGTGNVEKSMLSLKNMLIGGGVVVALQRLSAVHSAITTAAGEQEEATLRLTQTLRLNYQNTAQNIRALEGQAGALQKVTRYSDDMITSAQSQLMAIGRLNTEGVKKITPALLDFAAAWKMDLVSAAELFGKALGGDVNMLGRYSIEIDMAKDATGRMNDLLKEVNESYADQSKIKGYISATIHLKEAQSELNEQFGFMITGKEGGIAQYWADATFKLAGYLEDLRTANDLLKKYPMPETTTTEYGAYGVPKTVKTQPSIEERLRYALDKQYVNETWQEQQEFLRGAANAPPVPIKYNWGATPFARFGMNRQYGAIPGTGAGHLPGSMMEAMGGPGGTGTPFGGMSPDLLEKFADEDAEAMEERRKAIEKFTEDVRREEERMLQEHEQAAQRFGYMWGSTLYDMQENSAITFKNIGNMFADMARQMAMEAGAMAIFNIATGVPAGTGIMDMIKGSLGFAGGGYTGYGNPGAVAGSVHRGEYVFDAGVVGQYGPSFFDRLAGVLKKGGGGYSDNSRNTYNLSGVNSGISLEELAQKITQAKRHRLIA